MLADVGHEVLRPLQPANARSRARPSEVSRPSGLSTGPLARQQADPTKAATGCDLRVMSKTNPVPYSLIRLPRHHPSHSPRPQRLIRPNCAVTPKIRRAVVRADGQMIIGLPKSNAGIRDVAIPPHLLRLVKGHIQDFTSPWKDTLLFSVADESHLHMSALGALEGLLSGPKADGARTFVGTTYATPTPYQVPDRSNAR
jgi:hypothetical protein